MPMEVKKITLKDIAQASGYSLVSVHRALNNKEGVSKAVKQEILNVANEMGYTANYVASALKRRQVNLAVVLPEPEEGGKYYFRYIWKGCKVYEAEEEGYNMNVMNYTFSVDGDSGDREQVEILKNLYEEWGGQLDGLLTAPNINSSRMECLLSQFTAKGVAVVLIDNDFKDCGRLCCVAPNDTFTGQLAAELMNMVLKGQKGTILVAAGDEGSLSHKMNAAGFEEYFRKNNADITVRCIQDLYRAEANRQQMLACLREDKSIIGAYSVRARNTIPLCEAAMDSGRINELFLVGSDLFPENMCCLEQGIFSNLLHKNTYRQAYVATQYLTEFLLRNIAPPSENVYVRSEVLFRSSISQPLKPVCGNAWKREFWLDIRLSVSKRR